MFHHVLQGHPNLVEGPRPTVVELNESLSGRYTELIFSVGGMDWAGDPQWWAEGSQARGPQWWAKGPPLIF